MELRNLRAFLAVAEERHFGRAAARIHISQPGLTQRIQALERELGVRLLERTARDVRLTASGEALLPHARELIRHEDQALEAIRDHAMGRSGRIRISYLTLWDELPSRIMAEFRRRYPDVSLETTSGYSEINLLKVAADDVDIAFLGMGIGQLDGIVMRGIDRHRIVVIMAPSHRLAGMGQIPINSLRGEPMIGLSSGVNAALAAFMNQWLAGHLGEEPNIVALEPPDQIARVVANRTGVVALMTEARASAAAQSGVVQRQLAPVPFIDYGVAYRASNALTPLANFLRVIDDLAGELPVEPPPGLESLFAAPAGHPDDPTDKPI
ncbi:MAG TPA: LysR family transcriptional regulator [Candidatus Dormibacteraeota bacterium]|jgi:DNA-binding transcriptional LysR family regulator